MNNLCGAVASMPSYKIMDLGLILARACGTQPT